jgi:hypothetical protein
MRITFRPAEANLRCARTRGPLGPLFLRIPHYNF